jgi:hypothetical protein
MPPVTEARAPADENRPVFLALDRDVCEHAGVPERRGSNFAHFLMPILICTPHLALDLFGTVPLRS